jgi:hypothetical protein
MRPLGKDLRHDRRQSGLEIRRRVIKNTILEAVRIGQAQEASAIPAFRALQQDRCRRAG